MVQISSRSSRTRECHPVTASRDVLRGVMTSCHVSWPSCEEPPRILTSCQLLWKASKEEILVKLSTLYLPMTFKLFGWLSLFLPQCKRWRRKITDEVSPLFYADSRVWECETILTRSQSPPPVSVAVWQPWPPVATISTSTTYKYPAHVPVTCLLGT